METKSTNTNLRPDPAAPFEDKIQISYGKQIARFMSMEWFSGGMITNGCAYTSRQKWIEKQRLYTRGEQDMVDSKNIMARQKSDLDYLNLDWRPTNLAGKFCNIVTNGIGEENYRLDIRATDRYSMLEKKRKMDEHRKNMIAKNIMEKAKEYLNLDIMPKGFIPEDEDELQFHAQIKDRPKAEIGEEITINYIKKINGFKSIKDKCDKDAVEVGLMGMQVYTDPINGVSLRYVDPEYSIHSFVTKNDFSDCFYYGFVESITLSDIRRESNFDDAAIREIAKVYGTTSNGIGVDYGTCSMDSIIDLKINVLRFAWKTSKRMTYKKYLSKSGKTLKVAKRNDSWTVPEEGASSYLSRTFDTWLEGNFIIGTDTIYGYKECENIAFDEMDKVRPPFIFRATNIYKNRLHSFLSDIIADCDQMHYIRLKIQHLMAELKPDLIEVDLDSLADLSSGAKGENKGEIWKTALTMINVKGVIFKKRVDMGEMGLKEAAGARPVPQQQGSALSALLNIWAQYYNQIRENTGINPARDGSLPADALLGVNQMAQLASNTVTKHIVDAAIDFDLRVCEVISIRVKSIFSLKGGEKLADMYRRAVGKENIEAMEVMKDRHLNDFGFTIEMVPANQEISEFKEDLAIAMKEGTIDVEDKIEAQNLAKVNIKHANEYLKYCRKRRMKQIRKEKLELIAAQTEGNAKSAQAKIQSEVQSYGLKKKIDLEFASRMSQIEVEKENALIQINAPSDSVKFERDVYLARVKEASNFDLTKYKEEAKDLRIDKQSTQQSKMIKQRQDNTEPIDFEDQFNFDSELSI